MARLVAVIMGAVLLAGCRPPIGELPAPSGQGALSATCLEAIAPLVENLFQLESDVQVGMSEDYYSEMMAIGEDRKARVAIGQLEPDCAAAATAAGAAYEQYASAFGLFLACGESLECISQGPVADEIQRHWQAASNHLSSVRARLR